MSASALAVAIMLGNAPIGPIDDPAGVSASAMIPVSTAMVLPAAGAASAQIEPASETAAADTARDDITVTAYKGERPSDPLEQVNEKTFAAMQAVDKIVIGPVAHAYEHVVPKPARNGLRNFFRNLHEPVVFVNFLIQLKPRRAFQTLGRFAINSTMGGAGLFDVAKKRPFSLPFHPNGFANSLAFYGVKPGPYLVLPLIGPTTLRDLVGRSFDSFLYPLPGGRPISGPAYAMSSNVVKTLNRRVDFDGTLHELRDDNPHAYASMRRYYLQKREEEVAALHSRPRLRSGAPVELSGPVTIPVPPVP